MDKLAEMKQAPEQQGAPEFSLTEILIVLWKGRKLIVGGTVAVMILCVLFTLYMATYKSEGFYQFGGAIPVPKEQVIAEKDKEKDKEKEKEAPPGIALGDYKRYVAALSSSGRFDDYMQQVKLNNDPTVQELRRTLIARDNFSKFLEPIYPMTKLDAKELMDTAKDISNNVIGLRISYQATTPQDAQRMVTLLGRYTMDSVIYLVYSDFLRSKHLDLTSKITKLDNEIISNKERLESFARKGETLRKIVARYPDAAAQGGRQVVSVTEDNARYLSPATQLMSTEVDALMANEAILKAQREQKQNIILREYYDGAKAALDSNKSGEALLLALEAIKENVFKKRDLNDESVKEVFNMITVDNQKATAVYLEKSRFIAGPTLPENRTSRLSNSLLAGFLAGLAFFSLLVFGRSWWQANRLKMAD
ncbi:lipopolysaccharide biosynthesis protein [Janthinobacterium sp. FT14W]|uniref:lipopolysaccharide biosynthesis protein n=1 Tax=Janthinobacterium sp. FT14W TaxID=2654253 RepID=UPI001264C349|nr:lipopolysaccharide biosynthesis protein [Janthinobacterium sp. FT14W]KAB8059885.1 lipopolysaccharide biosynthesis protein [Janthinobacterium sp. FT14W]